MRIVKWLTRMWTNTVVGTCRYTESAGAARHALWRDGEKGEPVSSYGAAVKQPKCNERKFLELVLYIGEQMKDDPNYGATVLNKVLWNADFTHYRDHGTPITGAEYVKMPYGPAPKSTLPRIRDCLVARGRARIVNAAVGPSKMKQDRLVPVEGEHADLSRFSDTELAAVDESIKEYNGLTATAASKKTHDFIGYVIASMDEYIPYETILVEKPVITDDDYEAIRRVKERIAAGSA